MASPQQNHHTQELASYVGGGEDAFDTFIDMDFLRSNSAMDEDVDIGQMSNSDLFRYFFGPELTKGTDDPIDIDTTTATSFPTPMQDISSDFALLPSPIMPTEDLKISQLSSPITSTADAQEVEEQALTNTTAVAPSLAMLNAQLAELLAKLPLIKQEPTAGENKQLAPTANSSTSLSIISPAKQNLQPLTTTKTVASASPTGSEAGNEIVKQVTDLKKLSSKERRQLRNKISARNFRVRRKEYIQNLESNSKKQQEEINLLRQVVLHLQEENTSLKEENEELRKQQTATKPTVVSSPPSSPNTSISSTPPPKESNGAVASIKNNNNGNSSVRVSSNSSNTNTSSNKTPIADPHRPPSSPGNRYLVIQNVNKDASSTSQSQKTWRDTRVRVQTTFIPEFNLDKLMLKEKSNEFPACYPSDFLSSSLYHPSSIFMGKNGQFAWVAYALMSTLLQQMYTLFLHPI